MKPLLFDLLFVVFFNFTAAKCALCTAILVVPLWTFLVKPRLHKFSLPKKWPWQRAAAARRGTSPPRPNKKEAPIQKKRSPSDEPTGKTAKDAGGARAAAPKTDEALQELFHSPRFAQWYKNNRPSLLDQVQLRGAQRLWASLATTVVLLLAVFILPFFSLKNEDATLWTLLRRHSRDGRSTWRDVMFTNVALLLQLFALATLFTSVFMPGDAKRTAFAALAAFSLLTVEAAMVEHMRVGAGCMLLLGVVVWRFASVWGRNAERKRR